MPSGDLFQFVQIAYWLALSTWFGGVLFIAIAAPIVFRTVGEANPILPDVLSVNLEGQHGTLLAGSIVGGLLDRLAKIELICAGVLLITLLAQFFLIELGGNHRIAAYLRVAMFLVATAIVIYDWRVLWPRIWKAREQYIEHADEPEIANPAKEQFDREHKFSVTLLTGVLFLLLGIILFSATIFPKRHERPATASPVPAQI